jgi:hypothetical protein
MISLGPPVQFYDLAGDVEIQVPRRLVRRTIMWSLRWMTNSAPSATSGISGEAARRRFIEEIKLSVTLSYAARDLNLISTAVSGQS